VPSSSPFPSNPLSLRSTPVSGAQWTLAACADSDDLVRGAALALARFTRARVYKNHISFSRPLIGGAVGGLCAPRSCGSGCRRGEEAGLARLFDGVRAAGLDASDSFNSDPSRPPFRGHASVHLHGRENRHLNGRRGPHHRHPRSLSRPTILLWRGRSCSISTTRTRKVSSGFARFG
jgi:hypothetical protein